MPFTERAPRLIKSRAAGPAPVRGLQRSTRAHRLPARPKPAANSEFFALLCRLDTAQCQHLCHHFCARRLRLRRAVQLRQGGSVKRERRRMSPDPYSPGTQIADWRAQRTAILATEEYRGIRRKTRRRRLMLAGVGAAALVAVLA